MKSTDGLHHILEGLPQELQIRMRISMQIARRIEELMKERGLSKKQFADSLGRRPIEITKWLSGEHNFTIATLSMLTAYFNQPIIEIKDSLT